MLRTRVGPSLKPILNGTRRHRIAPIKSLFWNLVQHMAVAVVPLFVLLVPPTSLAQSNIPPDHTFVIIGGHEFLMPSTYIWNPTDRSSGKKTALNIHAYLPDLSPAGPENLDIRNTPGGGVIHGYSIHLSENHPSVERIVENLAKMRRDCDYLVVDRTRNGLQNIPCKRENFYKHFVYVENGNIEIVLACFPIPHPSRVATPTRTTEKVFPSGLAFMPQSGTKSKRSMMKFFVCSIGSATPPQCIGEKLAILPGDRRKL